MMGPYMLPIPVLSSAAMVFSLFAAFVFVPWLAARVKPSMATLRKTAEREHRQSALIGRWYDAIISPIMDNRLVGYLTLFAHHRRHARLGVDVRLQAGSVQDAALRQQVGTAGRHRHARRDRPVRHGQSGAPAWRRNRQRFPRSPHTRPMSARRRPSISTVSCAIISCGRMPWQGDIAVQLEDRAKRSRTSHEIAALVRGTLTPIAAASGARLTIAEAPPGPPVLAPMVIELYGPTPEIRRQVAHGPAGDPAQDAGHRRHQHLHGTAARQPAIRGGSPAGLDVRRLGRGHQPRNRHGDRRFRSRPAAEPAQSRTGGHRPAGADGDARQSRQPAGHAAAQPDGSDGSARRTGTFRQQARRSGDLPQGSARSRICHRRRGRHASARRFMACSMSTPR